MKSLWLRLLLLGSFAFWASGTAKYVHEQIEHHGHDCSLDDDDDDDDSLPPALADAAVPAAPSQQSHSAPATPKHPCMVCQMLAAMVSDHAAPPVITPPPLPLLGTLIVPNWAAPALRSCSTLQARGPPACILPV